MGGQLLTGTPSVIILKYSLYIKPFITGIVMIGEIGGQAEERAADYLKEHNSVSIMSVALLMALTFLFSILMLQGFLYQVKKNYAC